MSTSSVLPERRDNAGLEFAGPQARGRRAPFAPQTFRFPGHIVEMDAPYRNAELFYLQKQIQAQTPMVIVLEDGELIEGCIEWYDRNTIKVRGRWKTLIYKSAIKYMYKLGDTGRQPISS
jgi:sRNA-binding regulator protein Hfq